eukprot:UN4500
MVLALNVSVYFCKLLPLHMNGNLPVGIGMHVFAMICDLIMVMDVYNTFAGLVSTDVPNNMFQSVNALDANAAAKAFYTFKDVVASSQR